MSQNDTHEVGLDLGNCSCCMGCVELNPDVFAWDDNLDQPQLLKSEATEEEMQDVVACCPKDCIYLVDD